MKTLLLTFTTFLCTLTISRADAPKYQVIRIDSSAARDALRGPHPQSKVPTASIIGLLTQPSSNAILAKLDKRAKPIKAADAGFTISTATSNDSPKSIKVTVTQRGRSSVASVFEHQSLVVASPDERQPDGYRVYVLRLE